ncbi:shTK domain protein [Oesophagostomum dentatum]|uniref:ShTK domain protein n=1 Tax=Oesophagostomum dentatum TaxID=61180 RepID=A0A0B1TIC9_OESDE|nr:shTK domain protein [Oesophagostomum dentatum]
MKTCHFKSGFQPDYVDQFNKESSTTNYNYGMPYDYGSVMQYGASSASRNGKATMVAKDGAYQETMGSDMVSFYDVSMMNEHYNCKARCEAKGTNCQNGGFPNPNNCSICICPSGYGGTLCNERPPGCGETLTAGTNYAQMTSIVGDGTTQTKTDFLKCAYWIQAPPGKLVQVRLDSYQGYAVDGCIYGGVEIKSNPDQLRTGYRLCSDSDVGTVFTAASNLLPVITFNRYGRSKVTVSYRYVDSGHLQPEGDPTAGTPATTRIPQTITTTRPVMKCVNYFYDCSILAFFGYCDSESVRLQCSRACGLC